MGTDCHTLTQVLLTIAALSHLCWVAQPWVTEGPKPSVCRWLSIRHLVSNRLQLQLNQAVCILVIFLFDIHMPPMFLRLFTQVHPLMDGPVEGQYVTVGQQCSVYDFFLTSPAVSHMSCSSYLAVCEMEAKWAYSFFFLKKQPIVFQSSFSPRVTFAFIWCIHTVVLIRLKPGRYLIVFIIDISKKLLYIYIYICVCVCVLYIDLRPSCQSRDAPV